MTYEQSPQPRVPDPGAEEQASLFALLADATRLKLLKLLCRQRQPDALCVKMLAQLLGVSQPAVSQHLRVLRSAGLVKGERRGYHIHYSINREALEGLRQLALSALTVEEPETEPPCFQQCPITERSYRHGLEPCA